MPPLEMPRQGEFGWTLPDGDQPLSFQDLSRLLPQVGINWVKMPVWFDANDPRRGDELIRFVELLGASNIDVVGIIDRPPSKPGSCTVRAGHVDRRCAVGGFVHVGGGARAGDVAACACGCGGGSWAATTTRA